MEKILINEESLAKKSDVHFLPCKISYDGKANVKSFFTSSILHSDDSKGKNSIKRSLYHK